MYKALQFSHLAANEFLIKPLPLPLHLTLHGDTVATLIHVQR